MTVADKIASRYGAKISYHLKIEGVERIFTDGKRPTTADVGGGWIIGGRDSEAYSSAGEATIYRVADGTWTQVYSTPSDPTTAITAMATKGGVTPASGVSLYAVGSYWSDYNDLNRIDHIILSSDDLGATWTVVDKSTNGRRVMRVVPRSDGDLWVTRNASTLRGVSSYDGADTFTLLSPNLGNWCHGLLYADDDNVWVAGQSIYQWTGSTWSYRGGGTGNPNVLFGDGAAGTTYEATSTAINRWDSGSSWTTIWTGSSDVDLFWSGHFESSSDWWLVGRHKTGSTYYPAVYHWDGSLTRVWTSTDGTTEQSSGLFGIARNTAGEFAAVGLTGAGGVMVESADGITWTETTLPASFHGTSILPVDSVDPTLQCLNPPEAELSTGLDLKTMKVDASDLTIKLDNVRDPDDSSTPRKHYFGKLFAPGRAMAASTASSQIRRLDADDVQVDADATTIYVQSKEAFDSAGTAYLGNETFSYTGVDTETQTNFSDVQDIGKFTGCTRGLYPALGSSNRGRTYAYPITGDDLPGDCGDWDIVSTAPYTMIGREVGLYAVARESDGTWSETPALVWAGRIAEDITYDSRNDCWNLTAESILSLLDKPIPRRAPKAHVCGINLNGDAGRQFEIKEWNNDVLVAIADCTIPAGYYTVSSLQTAIAEAVKLSTNWTDEDATHWDFFSLEFKMSGGLLTAQVAGAGTNAYYEIIPNPVGVPCHAWQALGFGLSAFTVPVIQDLFGTGATETACATASERPYHHYHPTYSRYNGDVMRVRFEGGDRLWTDQGDWGTSLAWLRCEDQPVFGIGGDEGEYIDAYTACAVDTGDVYELTLGAPASALDAIRQSVESSPYGFIGSQDKSSPVPIENVYLPCQAPLDTNTRRGPLELLLFSLLSSGTSTYNDATYDVLPFDCSVHFPADLVDTDSFVNADKVIMGAHSDLADRTFYPLTEKDAPTWAELFAREATLWGLCLAWDRTVGKIVVKQIAAPKLHLAETTLDASTRGRHDDYPDVSINAANVVNRWVVECGYVNGKPTFKGTFRDPVSIRTVGEREVKIDHPGMRGGSQQIGGLLDNLFRNRAMIGRFAHQRVTVTLAPELAAVLAIGDVITYQANTAHPDPFGTGLMTCDTEGIVTDLRWSLKNHVGSADILLLDHTIYPWGAAALVDQSATNGGWDAANYRLTLLPLQFGESGDSDDGKAFGDGHAVIILESAPEDPSSYQSWTATVDGAYEADGANLLTVDAVTLTGWDATKEYVVICGEYSDCPADQKLLNTYQADAVSALLNSADSAQRYG